MTSAAPSAALLNAQLTAENVALVEELRVARREARQAASELRDLRQQYARQEDTIAQLLATQAQLKKALEHLLENRPRRSVVDPNQALLFVEELQALADSIVPPAEATAEPVVELAPEDAEVPDGESPQDEPPKKQRGKAAPSRRAVDQSNLRREVVRSELPEEQRRCSVTGVELVEVGVKVTEELDYRPGELLVIERHQVVYGPAPEIAKERSVEPIMAPPLPVAVEGVTASPMLLAWVLYQKYVLHLPLYRLEQVFAQLGLRISRKTLCDWVLKTAFAVQLLRSEIERQVRAGPVLGLDDTPVKAFVEQEHSGRRKLKQAYLWVFVNPAITAVVFRFALGRGTQDLASLLMTPEVPSSLEVILSDGLATNRSGAREAGLDVDHAGCWAHVLRKFREAIIEAPSVAKLFLDSIATIYAVDEKARREGLSGDALATARRRGAERCVIDLLRMTSGWKARHSLKGKMADAMRYLRGQRRALLRFLRDGRVPIDNNACERAIRPAAIGRDNWLFAGSEEGGDAAATFYTLVESARASGVDPLSYLEAVLRRIGTHPASRISELTPWAMAPELEPYRGHRAPA